MKRKIPLTFKNYNKKDKTAIYKLSKILKKNCIMDASVVQLCDYYFGKVKIELTKKQKRAILQLAKIKHQQNKKEAKEWARGGVFYLAYEQLTRKKKARKIIKNNKDWFYRGDISEVLQYAEKIVTNSFKKNGTGNSIGDNLHYYCKEIIDDYKRIIN